MVLAAHHLSLEYKIGQAWVNAIHDVSLTLQPTQIHGLVGESGSGKSTLALALMRYLTPNARYSGGSIIFNQQDLTTLSERDMAAIWGRRITMVPQNPLEALNPTMTIGAQMTEVTRRHLQLSREQAQQQAQDDLRRVNLADTADILRRYPHQLSGGMQQRVMIATAFSTQPDLLILDEPTTALDVTTQAVILDLVRERVRGQQTAVLFVSHNLGVIAQLCDSVTVLYGGEIMESAPVVSLFAHPTHPYTVGLLNSIPKPSVEHEARLSTIGGVAPSLTQRPHACVFADRCPIAIAKCTTDKPPVETTEAGHEVRCWRWREVASGAIQPTNHPQAATIDRPQRTDVILTLQNITKRFVEGSWYQGIFGRRPVVQAVDNVSFHINSRSTLGVVGESGSGKTTLARAIVALTPADEGHIELMGQPVSLKLHERNQAALASLRMIFQNPNDVLNPYHTAGQAIGRTIYRLNDGKSPAQIEEAVNRLLISVGLAPEYAQRFPVQLSGGEKQRVAIARAFAASPSLIVADEPTSALDVSVQATIVNLLKDLRSQEDVSYVIISHDLELIGYLAEWIIVMYLGEIVEQGNTEDVYSIPSHPYTEALLSAIPVPDPTAPRGNIRLMGDVPSPRNKPTGCPFHTRCPRFIGAICVEQEPPVQRNEQGHQVRCHYTLDELSALQAVPLEQS